MNTENVQKQKCSVCKQIKSVDNFAFQNRDKNIRHYKCRQCIAIYRKQYRANKLSIKITNNQLNTKTERQRVVAFIAKEKTKPCKDCNNTFPHYVMQFDHLNREEKSFDVGRLPTNITIEKIIDEISKCDLVCKNCHTIRTHKRGDFVNRRYLGMIQV